MKKNKTILIIDDDQDIRVYLRKILEGMGHIVFEAENSVEGMKIVSTIYPHLILLDINLENENGFHFISQVRMIDPAMRIKIVMISSSTSKKAIELSQRVGTNGYLVKPINNNILLSTLKKLMPEMDLPELKVINREQRVSFMVSIFAQIIKISEVALVIRSKVKFNDRAKLILSGIFLKKLEIDRAQFIMKDQSIDVSPGVYDTKVYIAGLKEEDLKKIRKLNTKKG